jgi:hypothetical protein
VISSNTDLSKSAQHSHRLDALFRHVPSSPSAGLFPAGNPARTHSAAPCELQSACRIFCDSYELCATLSGFDSEGQGTDELSDQASYEAAAQRRLDALRVLIRCPATTMNLVLAKAFAVSRSADSTPVETEAGQLAIGLVRQLEAIGDERHGRGQVRRLTDIAVAQSCRAFFDADRVYQETVSGHQMDHSAIDIAKQHRADALALVMSLQVSTMAEVLAKTEVVLHLFEWVGHDATDLGQLAIVALRELRSIAGARNV